MRAPLCSRRRSLTRTNSTCLRAPQGRAPARQRNGLHHGHRLSTGTFSVTAQSTLEAALPITSTELQFPAPVDGGPHLNITYVGSQGLSDRGWGRRSRLLGRPARSEVSCVQHRYDQQPGLTGRGDDLLPSQQSACQRASSQRSLSRALGRSVHAATDSWGMSPALSRIANNTEYAPDAATFMANYTVAVSMMAALSARIPYSDAGTGSMETGPHQRSVSTSNQPHHLAPLYGICPSERRFRRQRMVARDWGFGSEIFRKLRFSSRLLPRRGTNQRRRPGLPTHLPAQPTSRQMGPGCIDGLFNGVSCSALILQQHSLQRISSSTSAPLFRRRPTSSATRRVPHRITYTVPVTISWISAWRAASRYTSANPPG